MFKKLKLCPDNCLFLTKPLHIICKTLKASSVECLPVGASNKQQLIFKDDTFIFQKFNKSTQFASWADSHYVKLANLCITDFENTNKCHLNVQNQSEIKECHPRP